MVGMFQNKNQKDVGTTKYRSEGKGKTFFKSPFFDIFMGGWEEGVLRLRICHSPQRAWYRACPHKTPWRPSDKVLFLNAFLVRPGCPTPSH